ncbi:uncharacterized protein JCM6883_001978 [Sporobolomyces salmoneus]|uniref:uncharacterized protein n=1 Tax=Sporobolomyces salmoneus TaxID=183962 RepID=UPI00316E0167
MPSLSTACTSSFYQKLSFTLDDLDILDPKLNFSRNITKEQRLPGEWVFKVAATQDPPKVTFHVFFGGPKPPTFGWDIESKSTLCWVAGDGSIVEIDTCPFPLSSELPDPKYNGFGHTVFRKQLQEFALESGGRYKPETQRLYVFNFELRSATCPEPSTKAETLSTLYSSPLPNDLRFFFARAGGGLELFARTNGLPVVLQNSLRSHQFALKPKTGRATRNASSSALPSATLKTLNDGIEDYPDSDEEGDEVYAAEVGLSSVEPTNLHAPNPFRQVNVKDLRYSTFKALLCYLDSGYLRFAPLRSSCIAPTPASTRKSLLEKSLADTPKLPLPVSPKSIYRLALLYRLQSLRQLALSTYKTSLTVSNAAEELFSPLSLAHEEVQGAIIEFVSEHWVEIRDSQHYKDIVARIKRGELKRCWESTGRLDRRCTSEIGSKGRAEVESRKEAQARRKG